jgi:8-oxo-dGTP pyrophosphatase MutT (NUDIX family)
VTEERLFRTTDSTLRLDLGFLSITERSIEAPGGATFSRFVVEHPGAVAVVPVIGDDVILLDQYRAAVGGRVLEIPAGRLDVEGEPREAAAQRELQEETGFVTDDLRHLTDLWTAVGFSNERISIFLAEDITEGERNPVGPEEADAEIIRMSLGKALDLVISGVIDDAKTAVGLLLAANSRAST